MTTFPAWRTGPNGERRVFQRAEDVPEGWRDGLVARQGAVDEVRPAAFVETGRELTLADEDPFTPSKPRKGRRK